MKKKILLLMNIILLMVFVIMASILFVKNRQKPQNKIFPCMVMIYDGSYHGNGCVYKKNKDEIILLTTGHLLEQGENVTVSFQGGEQTEGSVIFLSEEHDLGFVSVKTEQLSSDTRKKIKEITCHVSDYDKLQQNDFMQYGLLNEDLIPYVREGKIGNPCWYVEDFEDTMLYIYCEAVPGMSGCGAYDINGNYIGMLIGGYDNESACLPITVIKEAWEEYRSAAK